MTASPVVPHTSIIPFFMIPWDIVLDALMATPGGLQDAQVSFEHLSGSGFFTRNGVKQPNTQTLAGLPFDQIVGGVENSVWNFVVGDPGTDKILVVVTDGNGHRESATVSIVTTATILPDLTSSTYLDTTTFEPGDLVRVDWTSFTSGAATSAPRTEGVYLSRDNVITTQDILLTTISLPFGISWIGGIGSNTQVTIPTDARGTYYLGVVSDIYNQVPESNESNNATAVRVTIGSVPELKEFYNAADFAYALRSGAAPNGFEHLLSSDSRWLADGFFAQAFRDKESGDVIIAFAGTIPWETSVYSLGTIAADLTIAAGGIPAAFDHAVTFARAVSKLVGSAPIYLTGHSLGGAEAEYVALTLGSTIAGGVTFGAPGVPGLTSASDLSGIFNYVDTADPIANFGNHWGPVLSVGSHSSPERININLSSAGRAIEKLLESALGNVTDALVSAWVYHARSHYAEELGLRDFSLGKAVHGYVAGALVYLDSNGNRWLDAGEPFTFTDIDGNFESFEGAGIVRVVGGVDTSTNLSLTGALEAPAGSTTVTPLTTIVAALSRVDGAPTASEAAIAVLNAFGLDQTIDLLTIDPVAGVTAGDAASAAVHIANVQIYDTIRLIAEAISQAGGTFDTAFEAGVMAISSMVTSLNSGQILDLTSGGAVAELISDMENAEGVSISTTLSQLSGIIAQHNLQLVGLLDAPANVASIVAEAAALEIAAFAPIVLSVEGEPSLRSLSGDPANEILDPPGGNYAVVGNGGHDSILFSGASTEYQVLGDTPFYITIFLSEPTSILNGSPRIILASGEVATYNQLLSNPLAIVFDGVLGDGPGGSAVIASIDLAGAQVVDAEGADVSLARAVGETVNLPVAAQNAVSVIDSVAGRDGVFQLSEIEALIFDDRIIFVEDAEGASIARLYSAALNRAPDPEGLFGWIDIYANNISASIKAQGAYASLAQAENGFGTTIAGGFAQSIEFQLLYGNLDDAGFVSRLYQNVLDREPANTEVDAWLSLMQQGGYTRDMVLVGFAESPENIAKTAADWLIQI